MKTDTLTEDGNGRKSNVNFATSALNKTPKKANDDGKASSTKTSININPEENPIANKDNDLTPINQAQSTLTVTNNRAMPEEPNLDIPDTKQPENTDNVRVVSRFRPLNSVETDLMNRGMGGICVKYHKKEGCVVTNSVGFGTTFTLDRVFDSNTTQKMFFDEVTKTSIDDIMKGYNGTIFTYGQSGSGKTHTMYGSSLYDEEMKGIIPRSIEYMFEYINDPNNEQIKFQIKFSMLEIYKENLFDLLNPETDSKDLKIKETKDKQVYIKGLTEEYISNIEEFLLLIHQADQYRVVSETGLNKQSSRSHLLFIIEVLQQLPDGSEKCGKLNLIDLAGSEKISKTGAVGETLEEAKKINLSLSTLGQVISSLSSDKDYIPYRDSKLTRVLQDSLGGNFKTTLIVACSPHVFNCEETIATMKFATRAKKIKNKVKQNIKKSTEELERIIEDLTQKLQKAKEHIARLKKKINSLPEALKQEYKEVFDDLHKEAETEVIEEKQPPKTFNKSQTLNTNAMTSESSLLKLDNLKIEGKDDLNMNSSTSNISLGNNKDLKRLNTTAVTTNLVNQEKANPLNEIEEKSDVSSDNSSTHHVKKPSFISQRSKSNNKDNDKKRIFTLNEEENEEQSDDEKQKSFTLRGGTKQDTKQSKDDSFSGSLYNRLSKGIIGFVPDSGKNLLKLKSDSANQSKDNTINLEKKDKDSDISSVKLNQHNKNQPSLISEISNHLNLQVFSSPCKKRNTTVKPYKRRKEENIQLENENYNSNVNNITSNTVGEKESEKQNLMDLLQATNSIKEKYEAKLCSKDDQIFTLNRDIETLNINLLKQKETSQVLKEKLKAFENKEEISQSKLEAEIEKIIQNNKAFIGSMKTLKSDVGGLVNETLKKENLELKKKLNNFEKEYFEVFKNLKYLESETFINSSLKKPVSLFDSEEEIFKKLNLDESSFLQYKETFKLSRSFMKDIIHFFITKQDFFNSNIYENLEMAKSADRYKQNNIKACFIK